jgi:hypothetical protein
MTTCLIVNWGVITILSVLLAFSEWLSKTDRFKENGVLDFTTTLLKSILHKGDQK